MGINPKWTPSSHSSVFLYLQLFCWLLSSSANLSGTSSFSKKASPVRKQSHLSCLITPSLTDSWVKLSALPAAGKNGDGKDLAAGRPPLPPLSCCQTEEEQTLGREAEGWHSHAGLQLGMTFRGNRHITTLFCADNTCSSCIQAMLLLRDAAS